MRGIYGQSSVKSLDRCLEVALLEECQSMLGEIVRQRVLSYSGLGLPGRCAADAEHILYSAKH
jgi:hypothetical protein